MKVNKSVYKWLYREKRYNEYSSWNIHELPFSEGSTSQSISVVFLCLIFLHLLRHGIGVWDYFVLKISFIQNNKSKLEQIRTIRTLTILLAIFRITFWWKNSFPAYFNIPWKWMLLLPQALESQNNLPSLAPNRSHICPGIWVPKAWKEISL